MHGLASTGIEGIDQILRGGFPKNSLYLVEGDPGSGKTTFGLQFLLEGMRNGESVLYVTLSETKAELESVGRSHGWDLSGMNIYELSSLETGGLTPEDQYTVFHPSEVELAETTNAILMEVERLRPARIVFDSLSEMRLLAREPLRYRRQILGLKQYFIGRQCTILLLDDRTSDTGDLQLHSLSHGVLNLEQLAPEFGAARRRLRIMKLRGVAFDAGYHDFVIERGGLRVFPRVVAAESRVPQERGIVRTGVDRLDDLFGGGLDKGSSTLVIGPAGSGKSALTAQLVVAAAERGDRASIYLFDEGLDTYRRRTQGLGMGLDQHLAAGRVTITQVDPAELSPGEFAHRIRRDVEANGARIIVIDSLNGFLHAMPEERFLLLQLHEVFMYLRQHGVTTMSIVAQSGLVGTMQAPVDLSYLADNVVLLRFFEVQGEVRQAISMIKKRAGRHERSIRELRLGDGGITLGEPLREFRGVLTGVPEYAGQGGPALPTT